MKLDFSGYIGSLHNVTFVDNNGRQIPNGLFNVMRDFLVMDNAYSNNSKAIDVEVIDIPRQPFHVLIQGKDAQGNHFSRVTYLDNYTSSNIFPQPILSIEVGEGSDLITSAGKSSVITFEVTNYRNTAADVRFYCTDEKSILGSMQPYRQIISPQQTTTVTLTLAVRYGTYQDTITFKATVGSEVVEKKVLVDVGMQPLTDNTGPSLEYSYLSDCSKVVFANCDQGTWTIEVKARDTGSGLLQVNSNPKGLYFSNGYTTGTKEEVVGSYSDSCCNADLQVTAVDRMNNRRTITANAYHASLGPGQISAIVLGIILLIIIIILIVYFVRKCLKKKETFDLPTYRGGRI
nr:uncharacterized protein LOC111505954 isoform X2 [Leptinotarsa decemlineata]XP_023016639.1 uncharacterized protein LOC111505954 isoform X2 [Leptinotarsa decemlineata]